ncbi:FecR/PupR family sigma factor regulator [Deefgea rivuli]|uniref:FecR/PupR family sigma factor regulator n=1 Tax=Deefgea rivuli TaxID=400948 RepID=UPI00048446FF|nr:DUF4880 domain-containing protein [Deefgea rivuli]
MSNSKTEDSSWQTAMDWLMRENESALSQAEMIELKTWLASDTQHQKAYQEAKTIWLGSCFIPTN